MRTFNDYVRDYQEMGLSRDDAEILAKKTFAIKAETDAEWKQGKYKTLKPAAKPKPHKPVFKMIVDHLGQQFGSTKEMCDFYKISINLFNWRRAKDWDLKAALTTPATEVVKDHLGHEFSSVKEMCAYWKITIGAFYSRRKKYGLKTALTTPLVKQHRV